VIGRIAFCTWVGVTLVYLAAPVAVVIISSFSSGAVLTFPPSSFTTQWYFNISSSYYDALWVSLIVAATSSALATIVGVPAGISLARGRYPGKTLVSTICLMPLTVPSLVIGVSLFQYFLIVYDFSGLTLGATLRGLILAHIVLTIPFVMRSVISSYVLYDETLDDAARNLGASPLRTVFLVTIPILRPAIISGAAFAFVMSFDDVPIALFVGGGSATTLPVKLFTAIEFDLGGQVMAISAIVVAASLVAALFLERLVGIDRLMGFK
jgi:putative spermidine/putrescine transport system permease protein